jgi:WD40 repeat protein
MHRKIVSILLFFLLFSAGSFSQQTELTFQTGHVAPIIKVVFSPDGNFLASSDDQNKICIWDMTCLTQITSFHFSGLLEGDRVTVLAFTPDNTKLLAGTVSGRTVLWDVAGSRRIADFNVAGPVSGALFKNDSLVYLTAAALIQYNIYTNQGTSVVNETIDDIYFDKVNNRFTFCSLTGQVGFISSSNEITFFDKGIQNDKVQKVVRKNTSIGITKLWGSSMVSASSFTVRFFNLGDQKKLFSASMPYMDENITDVVYLPENDLYLVSNTDGKIYIYDLKQKKLVRTLKDHLSEVNSLAVHPSRNIFVSGSTDRSIILWDANSFMPIKRFYARASSIETLELDKTGQYLAFGNELGYTKLINLTDKNPEIKSVQDHNQKITGIIFTDDGKSLITSANDNHISKINTADMKLLKSEKYKSNFGFSYLLKNTLQKLNMYVDPYIFIDSITVSSDQKYIAANGNQAVKKYKKTGEYTQSTVGRKRKIAVRTNIRNYELYFSTADLKSLKIRNPQLAPKKSISRADSLIMGVEVYNKVNGHISGITGAKVDEAANRLITSSKDATIKIWDLTSRKLVVTIIPVDRNKRIFITADNYYFAPKNALDAIGFKQGINFYPLEQFDLRFNRPDIVLSALKNPDTTLIKMYRNAYEKRLKKSGFNDQMFTAEWHTPDLEILNTDELGYTTDNSQIDLKISGTDSRYNLDRINVWVNDVPLYGTNGISLRAESADSVVKTLKVPLSSGNNRIQVSCMNEKGVESLKRSVDIAFNPVVPVKPNLYVIAMSVSKYQDTRYNLQYAVKDGKDIAALFGPETIAKDEFGTVHFDTLFNKNATRENFFNIKEKLLATKADDKVVVFVSGHGLLNKDLDFYFATYDIDFSNPESRGISFDDMERLLDSIPARKKLMMMDACHSGEVDKEEPMNFVAQNVEKSSNITFRGSIREYNFKGVDSNIAGSGTNLNSSFEVMQELFAGLDKGTGTVVISAAAGKGYALESAKWNNGVFTYSIINGLKNKAADKNRDKKVTISELRNYSISQVEILTGGNQKPTARREAVGSDWRIW